MRYYTHPKSPLVRHECERITATLAGQYSQIKIVPAFTENGVQFCHIKVR